jgi:hypothetical protein
MRKLFVVHHHSHVVTLPGPHKLLERQENQVSTVFSSTLHGFCHLQIFLKNSPPKIGSIIMPQIFKKINQVYNKIIKGV